MDRTSRIAGLRVTIYANEEGLLRQLPFYSRATFLWWYHVPASRQQAILVGDAVLVGLPDHNGDSIDLPGKVSDTLVDPGTWRVEVRTLGDPKWYRNQATYADYFEALVWAIAHARAVDGGGRCPRRASRSDPSRSVGCTDRPRLIPLPPRGGDQLDPAMQRGEMVTAVFGPTPL